MKFKAYISSIVFILITISTYSQIDSLENRKIYNWKLDPYDLSIQLVELDTSLASFQNFNPLLKNTISSNYLGNLGSAAQSKIYYDRKVYKTGFVFSEPYAIYFHLPKDQLYFNTKRQFTLFNYGSGGPKNESEQVLGVLHTQNVNKDFNFGFDYDMISSDGRYQNQQVKQNKITLFSSYQKKGYRLHVNVGLNRVKAQENGGIDSLHYLGSDEYKNRKNIPVKLDDARNQVFNTGFYLAQEYEISNKFRKHFGDKIHKFNFKDDKNNIKLKICNVDSFQGQEADIVLLSFVRSKKVGFLDSRNRLNVALSRAKYYQVLFGNRNFFKSRRAKRRSSELNYLANYLPHISSLR